MCSNDADRGPQSVAFAGLKGEAGPAFGALHAALAPASLAESYRLQLYDYAQAANRLRFAQHAFVPSPYGLSAYHEGQALVPYGLSPFVRLDPRTQMIQEEPKPQHSYIGLIAMAILSSSDKKMVLSDIYQYILDHYPYFRNRGPGWRNSIRHNLSLNDCFVKAGRSANGKGHYWAIHPANVEDFKKGDFRRRKAQRKVRKHMGLAVPDDEDSPGPTPPPDPRGECHRTPYFPADPPAAKKIRRKRQFDVESLLAPDPVTRRGTPPGPERRPLPSPGAEGPGAEEGGRGAPAPPGPEGSVRPGAETEADLAAGSEPGWTGFPLCTLPLPPACWTGGGGGSVLPTYAGSAGGPRLPAACDPRALARRWRDAVGRLVATSDEADEFVST
ncbi:forkhead box protein E3-like [Centruroides sculpturatus]|uniref:forkhead box protein E3-like n=1 Tax=Centruroides sculpturatus TaxID=218467 RepID=UPI000C6DE443|nr:forkhead box protein E3-like [Centruroides sculpturatus]